MSDDAHAWLAGRTPHETPRAVDWGRGAHRLQLGLHATADPTPDSLTTSVRGVLFRRNEVIVVRDPGGEHVIPGGRREAGESLLQTLTREIAEETGWGFSSARPFATLHFRHLTPMPDDYRYPYPDFFQPLYVLEAGDYDRRRIVRDEWESRSRMTPIARARAMILDEQRPILALALAAQRKHWRRRAPSPIFNAHRSLALDGAFERRSERIGRFFVGFRTLRGKTREDRTLLELLDPVADSAGYEIVRLRLMGGGRQRHLQIFAEDTAGEMTVEDCARLSRAIVDVLEAATPIEGDYALEVSSPGIDRPLTRLKDFQTFAGLEAKIELDRLAEGRKRFKGVLAGAAGDQVLVDLEGEDEIAEIPFSWISEAKLVLTDELLKRGAAKRAERLQLEQASADAAPEQ